MDHAINLLSLSLAVAPMYLALVVISYYIPNLRAKNYANLSSEELLIAGILVSFAAFIFNSLFWWMYFFTLAAGMNAFSNMLFENGQLVNIFTRHIPYTVSAVLHLVAYAKFGKEDKSHKPPKWHIAVAFSTTIVSWLMLQFFVPSSVIK